MPASQSPCILFASGDGQHHIEESHCMRRHKPARGAASRQATARRLCQNRARLPLQCLRGKARAPPGKAAHLTSCVTSHWPLEAAVMVKPAHTQLYAQGFAQRLISAAISESQRTGTRWLYVHAAAENMAAVRLYVGHCGFTLEQEETEVQARRLSRPRRMLFSQQLH